jgi:hypothetical protein
VCFRYIGPVDRDVAHLRRFNKTLVERLQSDGTVFLTGTELRDTYALRACVMHYATEPSDVTVLIDTVLDVAARLNEPAR